MRSAPVFHQRGRVMGGLMFHLFDRLEDVSGDLTGERLSLRKALLEEAADAAARAVSPHLRLSRDLLREGADLLKSDCGLGLEGVVSKRANSAYEGGERRRRTWLKSKCRLRQEVVIGGYQSDLSRFKALSTGVYEGGVLTYVGHVGTGYSQATAADLMKRLRPLEVAASPNGSGAPPRRGVNWVQPALVANIEMVE